MELKENFTQREYDQAIIALRSERAQEYDALDKRSLDNERQIQELRERIQDITAEISVLMLDNRVIRAERNSVCRRYNEKQITLRKLRDDCLGAPKELSSTVAYQLHNAVEHALKEALADNAAICLEGIKCNYHYDDSGKITFSVNIPRNDDTE